MAYDFDGTNDNIEALSAVVTGVPLSMACWFRADNTTTTAFVMGIGNSTGTERYSLQLRGALSGDLVAAQTTAAGTNVQSISVSGTPYRANVWHHLAGRYRTNTNRLVYFDGVSPTSPNTTSAIPAGLDRTIIGCNYGGGAKANFFNGKVAEAGIWNVDLTEDEFKALAKGYPCNKIRPQNLVFYAPLIRDIIDYAENLPLINTEATVFRHTRRYG